MIRNDVQRFAGSCPLLTTRCEVFLVPVVGVSPFFSFACCRSCGLTVLDRIDDDEEEDGRFTSCCVALNFADGDDNAVFTLLA